MQKSGFTLTELLVALTLLGVIAVFTIPKVVNSQNTKQFNAKAHQIVGALGGAYSKYQLDYGVSPNIYTTDLIPYLSYVNIDTTSTIDGVQTQATISCSALAVNCARMQNGGMLMYYNSDKFGGSASNYCLRFWFDPDGKVTSGSGDTSANASAKSLPIYLYTNNDVRTSATVKAGTWCGPWPISADATKDPPWFTWD